jgi:hypothetical protein
MNSVLDFKEAKMVYKYSGFRKVIKQELQKLKLPEMREVRKALDKELRELLRDGVVYPGPFHKLGGKDLEIYVRHIFDDMGFKVELKKCDESKWDGIILPFTGLGPQKPMVLEVKSSDKKSPKMDDLRQLDDWVFQLSGEEKARKGKLPGGIPVTTVNGVTAAFGWMGHPEPYKGVFVFNGQLGVPFKNRVSDWLEQNQSEFIQLRDFCIISLECLICWYEQCKENDTIAQYFWSNIHSTCGVLQFPDAL